MTPSRSKCRIVGIELGKVVLNFIHPGIPPLTAEFSLIREDQERAGLLERRMGWGERTMKAIAELQAAMEEDTLEHVFEPQPAQPAAEDPQQV